MQDRLNARNYTGLTWDKALFYAYARSLGLSVPRLYGVIDRPVGWATDGIPLRTDTEWRRFMASLEGEIIVKPALGTYGRGLRGYTRVEGGFKELQSDDLISVTALTESLL